MPGAGFTGVKCVELVFVLWERNRRGASAMIRSGWGAHKNRAVKRRLLGFGREHWEVFGPQTVEHSLGFLAYTKDNAELAPTLRGRRNQSHVDIEPRGGMKPKGRHSGPES